MARTQIDYSAFNALTSTYDNLFYTGRDGVRGIYSPKDKRTEFIIFEDGKTFVRPISKISGTVMYKLEQVDFEPKAKAVLMDLDGTSVRSESFWIWIIQSTVARLTGDSSFKLEEEDLPYVSGFSVSEHLKYCINKYCPDKTVEEAREYYFEITRYEMDRILKGTGKMDAFTPTPHLKEFLYALKDNGIKIGLVTSGLYEKAMPEIVSAFNQLGMGDPEEFYDAIITAGTAYSSGTGTLGELCAKPHPWLYAETAAVGLGITPDQHEKVIGIEDSSAGVMSIVLAGFQCIGMDGGNIHDAGLDSLLCKKSDNFLDILETILG